MKQLVASENFDIEISSFQQKVNYSVKYQALPLSNLIINGVVAKTSQCTASVSWVNCLQTDTLDLQVTKCTNDYSLNITYKIDNNEEFTNASVPISIANYTNTINLKCKRFVNYSN
jgi:hypothetical protein